MGKSWLATTLAAGFAKRSLKTLLIDGDLGNANIDVLLHLEPETDLAAVVAGWVELEDAIYKFASSSDPAIKFDILPGRSGSGALGGMPAEESSRLAASITALALQYDVVLVDLGPSIEDNVMRLMRACDHCLIVSTDEPTSMTDAYTFLKIASGYASSVSLSFVINAADTRVGGRRTYEALAQASQTFLKFRPPLAGVILRDPMVRRAVREQRIIFETDRDSQAGRDVTDIVERLCHDLELVRKKSKPI